MPRISALRHAGALLYAQAMSTQNRTPLDHIRNFSIVAHIDHGKSTLADRLIQTTGGLAERDMSEQVLDSMDIERERGITIKAQTVRLHYKANDGETYVLNLIDTPGHVDFAYEVSRSLSACEGSLLVVDASQGVEAQTLANVYQAIDNNHEIVTVLNKIDLPAAEPDRIKEQIEEVIGIDASEAVLISAKTGLGIPDVLEAIVKHLPAPKSELGDKGPLKALLVDSWYDTYLGVMVLVRVIDGVLTKGQTIRMMGTDAKYQVERVGVLTPKMLAVDSLGPGEIGFLPARSRKWPIPESAIPLRKISARQPPCCPVSSPPSPWCSVGSFQSMQLILKICVQRWANFASMTRAFRLKWKVRQRWASVSAAASWACCIWKSFRSGWSVSSTLT